MENEKLKILQSQLADALKEVENQYESIIVRNEKIAELQSLLQQSELEKKKYVEALEKISSAIFNKDYSEGQKILGISLIISEALSFKDNNKQK